MSGLVFPLADNQRLAGDPRDNVWLSASAGTGKTQVLSARVLRLLLRRDVAPSQILCLTFTKAGAAEMANRINAVLARWVRLPDTLLAKELDYLGADVDPATLERARSLFACVLDCPGGGLRIDTIHAFAQFLIASFPEEAGMVPGAEVMEDRTRDLLAREVLTDVLEDARRAGDTRLLDAVDFFVTRKEPAALHKWLMRAADVPEMWKGTGAWSSPMDARVRQLLGMPADADETWAYEPLDPDIFPDDHVLAMITPLEDWRAATADKCLAFIREWLALDHAGRIAAVSGFRGTVLKADGTPALNLKKPRDCPEFAEAQDMIAAAIADVELRQNLLAAARMVTAALEIGRAFAIRWEERKAREGLLDFSDLIRKAATLLSDREASDWIRYKLDRHFDHILIDEAQDTNQSQWDVVFALIDDFFSGEGARGDKLRTIFTVGDYKQAIFGFQGTSPENFARAKSLVETRIRQARDGILSSGAQRSEPGWRDLDLGKSFRTSAVVLDFVNAMIERLGHDALGLDRAPTKHVGEDRAGLVTLWPPVVPGRTEDDEETESEGAETRDWLPRHDVLLAERIADQVHRWVSGAEPFVLEKGRRRHAGAGDIMILVRQRKDLAAQIVAKLFSRGVPVAGVDRLRLGAPLAVKDVLAALRFASQPLDDLALANLLASPLIGWSQDDLLAYVPRGDMRLWDHLKRPDAPAPVVEAVGRLRELLRLADYQTPQALITWILTGPWRGRARLVERLGSEVNDPLDELVNAAFVYESEHWPSLSGFLAWFDAGTGELKRDADSAGEQVRVMTVHGSKGLQAPIVILADATGAPGEPGDIALADDPLGLGTDISRAVPLPPLAKHERIGPIAEAQDKAHAALMQEHWRLLYVAVTRAEEALFIGGSLNRNEARRGVPHEDSWYARLDPLFGPGSLADPVWTWRKEWGRRAQPLGPQERPAREERPPADIPDWVHRPVGAEPRPPRPLAPSSLGEDLDPEAPSIGDSRDAARRGDLIHRLLERLPDVAPEDRDAAARAWLAQRAADLSGPMRDEILAAAQRVLANPDFAAIFSPAALAEVPLTATVGGVVIAGTVDRLLVEDGRVTVIDFKTTRRPPRRAEDISPATLRQMAAYVAALQTIYPEASVRAAVLYTHTPVLIEIPAPILAEDKRRLESPQESLFPRDIE